ncbi:tubd1, partial [Symbiodinium pilosum]
AMKLQGFAKYLKSEKVTAIHTAVTNLNTFQFPMCLVELKDFLSMGQLVCHEAARATGQLRCFDRPEEVVDLSLLSGIVFISHQWAGFDHPDPEGEHYQAILVAIRGMSERGLKCGYIWVDYTSIPQANAFQQQAAINSLAVYASLCSALVSVAPNCKHADTGADLNVQTYCARGWCRLELLSFKTGTCKAEDDERAAYLCDGLSFKSIQESDVALEDDLVLHVLGGSFTCCSRCHPGGVQCDRQKTRDVLLGIYWRLLAMRRDGDMQYVIEADRILQLVQMEVEKYFPAYTWYRSAGHEEMQELFDGYLPLLHK